VADFSPIARSPIAPAEPVVAVEGWEVSGARSSAPLRIVDCAPLAKVGVRADADGALARTLGVRFGRAERDRDGTLVVGAAPGEWMLLAAPGTAPAVAQRVQEMAGDEFVSVIDLTRGRALLRLAGEDTVGLLAKVCAIDLDERTTPNGSAFRSSVAKLVTDVIRDDESGVRSYLLHCEWSSGQYLFDSLVDAGGEFGIEVDGFRHEQA
jgi:heterotetrameric sarcosine oxidase gamma subunit